MTDHLTDLDWKIRLSIYQFFVKNGRPPSAAQMAAAVGRDDDEVRRSYHRLHRSHAIFLEPGTDDVRMANPLSAIPTAYRVQVCRGQRLYANCAWDSLGIPAMLNADARIKAQLPITGEAISYAVEHGELQAESDLVVHFPIPFRDWYNDLVNT